MLDILSVSSSVLTSSDILRVQDWFATRIQCNLLQTPIIPHRLDPCDFTIAYRGEKQAVFVREWDAHDERCDCSICVQVRELLDWPAQELTPKNIWWTTTRLLPFDESGDRRIFLAHVAHSICDHINTDPPPMPYVPRGGFDLCLPLRHGWEIDLEAWRVRRNVTPKEHTPIWYF